MITLTTSGDNADIDISKQTNDYNIYTIYGINNICVLQIL